jgi:hypothetical protein
MPDIVLMIGAGPDIYTEDGQLGLPITPEMLLSG